MKRLKKLLPILAAAAVGSVALAAPKFVCGLTGQESDQCCCEQRNGSLVCKNTGQTLDACCCKTK